MPESELLARLSAWYRSQCDGEWEHELGIVIDTIDNPGWLVKIDLRRTGAEGRSFAETKIQLADDDWLMCSVKDAKFIGAGDPSKLAVIVDHFLRFAESSEKSSDGRSKDRSR